MPHAFLSLPHFKPFRGRFRLAALFLLIAASPACPQDRGAWLVLPLETLRAGALDVELGAALSDLIGLELAPLDVVDRSRLEQILHEQEIAAGDRKGLALGQLVKADALVTGSLEVRDGRLAARVRLVDVETGVVRHTVAAAGTQADLAGLASNIALDLKRAGKVLPAPGAKGLDVEGARFRQQFSAAVAAHLSGDSLRAIPRFLACLKARPRHGASRLWLARAYLALGSPLEAWVVLDGLPGEDGDQIRKRCLSAFTVEEVLLFHERIDAGK